MRSTDAKYDDIQAILRRSGAHNAALDRLAQIAVDMREIEWKLARRTAAAAKGQPKSGGQA